MTNNSSSITRLALQCSNDLDLDFKISRREDKNQPGNISLYGRGSKLDFSSHYISKHVIENYKFEDSSLYESYSRDFTINCIHRDVEQEKFFDPTERGISDAQKNIISCIINEKACFSEQPQRVFRCLKFITKYNMNVDPKIEKYLRDSDSNKFKRKVNVKYISKIINYCMKKNPKLCIDSIYRLNLSPYIPINGELKRFLISEKKLIEFMDNQDSLR